MKDILRLSLPLTVWLIGFSVIYALQGLACSRHWPPGLEARPVLLVALGVIVLVQGAVLICVLRTRAASRFAQTTGSGLAVTAMVASVWTMLPVVAVSICR